MITAATISSSFGNALPASGTPRHRNSHIDAHELNDSQVQIDHSTQMSRNIPAVFTPSSSELTRLHGGLVRARARPCLSSRSELKTTNTASPIQNTASCQAIGKSPRSQNHWYECSSQVATNTMTVASTSAVFCPYFFRRKNSGM